MSPEQVGILLAVIVLIIFSALFSASEMAYSTASKIRLTNLENDGNKKAGKVLKVLEKYDKLLSTVLIGNNIVNIAMATLGTVLFTSLLKSQDVGATVSTVVITVVVLIFGEITPKTLAKQHPEKFAMFIYGFLMLFYYLLTPLTVIFSGWKWLLAKIFRFKKNSTYTEDELITIVETAENEGELEAHESELIKSAIEFEDLDVKDVMTPRVNVCSVEISQDVEKIYGAFAESGFSRLPVYEQTIDSIVGILHEKDFNVLLHDGKSDIRPIIQKCIYVSPTLKISTVLSMLQKAKVHMAIVVDEFGGTEGIVTLEDILEELVGEIYDEHDEEEVSLIEVGDNTFIVRGDENFEEITEQLELNASEEIESTTVGGVVTELLDRIPVPGDSVEVGKMEIEVLKATEKKVEEVKITLISEPDEE